MEQLLSSMNLHEIIIIFFFSSLSSWVFRSKKFYVRFILGHVGWLFSSWSKQGAEEKREKEEELRLNTQEMKVVMEVMGFGGDGSEGGVSAGDMRGLFDVEPSLEEVKEAFSVFDENLDGFIDAEELYRVLSRLGFPEASNLESCRRMIRAYDDNSDGKIDFPEFVKCLEGSFSCS